ncbi:sirohydrochlorin chelatase [Neptuniibacter sp. PT8_73]|uniref:sirohydrochlorin chelatase n=1 Tax=Neptuniibacter sp. PT8_73 TaxID=3398206 RepID=UPI0039F451F1
MKSLVIVAHGSRREHSNNEVLELTASLQNKIHNEYPIIETAFLELARPSIEEAIDKCIQQGSTDIKILPYFLSAGIHVHEDIPQEAERASMRNKNISVEVLPHLGSSLMMLGLLEQVLVTHGTVDSAIAS